MAGWRDRAEVVTAPGGSWRDRAEPVPASDWRTRAEPVAPEPAMSEAETERAKRDYGYFSNAIPSVLGAHKTDFLSKDLLGEKTDFGPSSLQQVQDYQAQREQASGGPVSQARAVTPTGQVETPGVIRTFLEAGMRPSGAAVTSLAEQSEARIRRENPTMPTEEVNRRVMQEQSGLDAARRWAAHPGELAVAAKRAAFAYHPLDPKHEANVEEPTIIKAVPALIERYGENKALTSEPVLNAIRALAKMESIAPTPQTVIERIASGKFPLQNPFGPIGPEEEQSTKTIPAPWGRMSAPQGAALGLATAMTPVGDVNQIVLGGGAKAIGSVGKAGGAALQSVRGAGAMGKRLNAALNPNIAQRVNAVGERAGQSIRTSGAARFFRGAPAVAEKIAVDMGRPEIAKDIELALLSVGPKQMQELRPVLEAVVKAKKIPESEFENIWISLQASGPRAQGAYQVLTPEAREVVDLYRALRKPHGLSMQRTVGTIPKKQYAYSGITPEARELATKAGTPLPPSGMPDIAPKLGGYHRNATLADRLTIEARSALGVGHPAVETIPEINRAVNRGGGPVAAGVKGIFGESPIQANPAKNIAQRFGQGALEKPWAETIKDTFAPLARKIRKGQKIPEGWAQPPTNSLAYKVLGEDAILPKSAIKAIAKSWQEKSAIESIMSSAPVQAWRAMTTTVAGPGYHARNFSYNVGKLADEFRPDELAKIEKQMVRIKSGDPSIRTIVQAAKDAGTWEGTGGAPGGVIREIRRESGLASNQIPTLRKVYKAASDAASMTDESARMRAILGFINRGSTPERAIEQAKSLITYTGQKSPAEKLTNLFAPFPTWWTREFPRAGARMATGGLTWPVKAQNYMEATTPPESQVPERFQPRRFREQSGMPLAGKTGEGLARGLVNPASPVGPVSQGIDAAVQAVQGAKFGDVMQAGAQTLGNQMWSPVQWGIGELTGKRPITGQPLESLQKATGYGALIGEHFPELAKKLGIYKGPGDRWFSSVRAGMYLGFLPYGAPARVVTAPTQEERDRAFWNFLTGVPTVALDPSRENQAQSIETSEDVRLQNEHLKKRTGIPRIP